MLWYPIEAPQIYAPGILNYASLRPSTLGKFTADYILKYVSYPRKQHDISCNLSPVETICMKCQILFPRKNIYKKKCLLNQPREL